MNNTHTANAIGIEGVIDTRMHDADSLREQFPLWDEYTKEEKLIASRTVAPVYSDRSYNVTTQGLHRYIVDNLDPDNTSAEANVTAAWMALGDDGTSGTAVTNTDLNNRVYAEQVTDHADNGSSLLASTFVDSNEANGFNIDEIGLFTGDPANLANADVFMLNHSAFSQVTKDGSKTVTFDVTLTFSDV